MDLLLAIVLGIALCGLGAGLCRRQLARPMALLALAAAGVAQAAALAGPATRTLEATHTFAAYAADGFEVVPRHFPVDRVAAAGWQWPLPFVLLTLVWAGLLWRWSGSPRRPHPVLVPLLLAWSGTAAWLAMQKLAAPAAVVQPFGLDRFLFPACVAMAVLVAGRGDRFRPVLMQLCLGTAAARLPAALFSKLASDGHWGTGLDVHTITAFVNPIARIEVEVAAGSWQQQAWLIWGQHLFFLPGVYLLSLGGIAFGLFLYRTHPPGP